MEKSPQQLAAKDAIIERSLRYAHALDAHDFDAIRACMADEIEADFSQTIGMPPTKLKADDMVAYMRAQAPIQSLHVTTNHIVELTGEDTALSRAYIYVPHRATIDGAQASYLFIGRLELTFRKIGSDWLISGLRPQLLWEEGDPRVIGRPAA